MATVTASEAFQWIFDNAESISINRRNVVAQTTARDGTTRAISRGGNVWRFSVKMPDGYRYSEYRDYLAAIDYADRFTSFTVDLNNTNNTGSQWLSAYQGSMTQAQTANVTANITASNTLTISNLTGISNGVTLFGQGDFLQLKSSGNLRASVYTVTEDVVKSSTTATVTVHRPFLNYDGNSAPTYGIAVGNSVRWQLLCTKMPAWTVTPAQLITWSGEFEFVEDLHTARENDDL